MDADQDIAARLFTEGWDSCKMGNACTPPDGYSNWEKNHWIRGWDENFISLRTAFDQQAWFGDRERNGLKN
jgi:hypothetical protein